MLDLKDFALKDKSGRALAPVIEDMRGRADALLICNFAADDPTAPICAHLLEKHSFDVAAGLRSLAEAADCSQVILYAGELDVKPVANLLQDADLKVRVCAGTASPVLREPTALYSVIDTGMVHTALAEQEYRSSFLSFGYQGRPTLTLDAETAYVVGELTGGKPQTKHIAVVNGDTEVKEVPLGTALKEVLGENAGAYPVLFGGVAGRFLTEEELQSAALQHIWENDTAEIIGEGQCIVARMAALYGQISDFSCARCVMCREGSWQLSAIFNDMASGHASTEDIVLVEEIAPMISAGSLCEFGRKMVGAGLSAVQLHKEPFKNHIDTRLCADDQCEGLKKYLIDPAVCSGCGDCLDACPEDAITGQPGFIHMIEENYCNRCGKCAEACEEKAVKRTGGRMKVPKRLTKVGRFH